MPETADTSYLNVSFSASQQALLESDLKKINDETDRLKTLQSQRSQAQGDYDYNQQRLTVISGNCMGLKGSAWNACSQDATNKRNQAGNLGAKLDADIAVSKALLDANNSNSYIARYNNDLKQIQNAIKLQIQQQQANLNAQQQATANTPQAVLAQQQASLQAQEAALAAKNESRNTTLKYAAFVIVSIAVIWAAITIIKK